MINEEHKRTGAIGHSERVTPKIRLPGFINEEDIGLGDVVRRMTHAVGIQSCGGCERRAAALNRSVVFSGRRAR